MAEQKTNALEPAFQEKCPVIVALEIINDWGATQIPGEVRACRQARQAQRETGQEPPAQE